jgi:hypothetical protein
MEKGMLVNFMQALNCCSSSDALVLLLSFMNIKGKVSSDKSITGITRYGSKSAL